MNLIKFVFHSRENLKIEPLLYSVLEYQWNVKIDH